MKIELELKHILHLFCKNGDTMPTSVSHYLANTLRSKLNEVQLKSACKNWYLQNSTNVLNENGGDLSGEQLFEKIIKHVSTNSRTSRYLDIINK